MSTHRKAGVERRISAALDVACRAGGLTRGLVCTHEGLLVASAAEGEAGVQEHLAALTSLFADIVARAERDLEMQAIDEVTLLDASRGRVVIRPLGTKADVRMFLVVDLPRAGSWRRTTNQLVLDIHRILDERYAEEGE